MSRNKKPRKAYHPKEVSRNTIGLALHFAAKPTQQDREEVLSPMRNAIKALREGVGTEMDWSVAAGGVAVAKAIERQGVVRGLHEHIAMAETAMQAIYDRAMRTGGGRWTRTALWFNEMDALANFVDIHDFQFNQLSRKELLAAIAAAEKETVAQGHTAAVVRNIDAERIAA